MRRLTIAVSVLVIVVAMVWLLWPERSRPQLRPANTVRALRLRLKRPPLPVPLPPAPVPVDTDTDTPAEPLALRIDLEDHWQASISMSEELALAVLPESYWPRADEVPFPELESVDRFQEAVDSQLERRVRSNFPFFSDPNEAFREASGEVEALIEAGEDDGLITDEPVWDTELSDDPWTLLHQAQLLRTAEMATQLSDELRPGQEEAGHLLAESGWLADALVERDPEHPAADYARLLRIEATTMQLYADGVEPEPQRAVDAVTEALEASEDPLVLETAMLAMLGTDADKLEGAETAALLDQVEAVLPDMKQDVRQVASLQAVEIAIRTAPDRVDAMLALARQAEADPEELTEAHDDLVARGLREVDDWRTELVLTARTCHRQTPVSQMRFELHGVWEKGWSFRPEQVDTFGAQSDVPDAWLACLAAHAWTEPPPSRELVARVEGAFPPL